MARIVNANDPIPHYPPTTFGYVHHRPEFWSVEQQKTNNGSPETNLYKCDDIDANLHEDVSCSNSMVPFYSLDDHTKYYLGVRMVSCV